MFFWCTRKPGSCKLYYNRSIHSPNPDASRRLTPNIIIAGHAHMYLETAHSSPNNSWGGQDGGHVPVGDTDVLGPSRGESSKTHTGSPIPRYLDQQE